MAESDESYERVRNQFLEIGKKVIEKIDFERLARVYHGRNTADDFRAVTNGLLEASVKNVMRKDEDSGSEVTVEPHCGINVRATRQRRLSANDFGTERFGKYYLRIDIHACLQHRFIEEEQEVDNDVGWDATHGIYYMLESIYKLMNKNKENNK